MSNMRISWPNRLADAVVTGATGDWTTNLPPSNLQTRSIAQVARSISAAAAALFVDTGTAVPVGVFAAVGHNMTTAADVRLRGYTANPRGTTWFDLGPAGVQSGAKMYGGEGSGGTGYPGTYWGADGLLKISTGGGRFTHTFGTGGPCLGLLLEPERANLLLHSRDGTQSAWTKVERHRHQDGNRTRRHREQRHAAHGDRLQRLDAAVDHDSVQHKPILDLRTARQRQQSDQPERGRVCHEYHVDDRLGAIQR
ncbi:MAG: hypothetical protein IPN11_14605 [Opitutaceae bacterium]|nr:hypothetical protein [Opitutaceae bacterium]